MNRLQKMLAGMILGKDTTRALSLTEPKYWRDDTFAESGVADEADAKSVLGLSAAWACVNLLAGTIASLPMMVYRPEGKGRVVASNHPLYRVLHLSLIHI